MKKIVTFICMMVIGLSANAQNKNAKTVINVDGICNSCKSRIEKTAIGVKGVKYAKWDKTSHQLQLIIDERKANVGAVQSAIAKAGHSNRLPDGSSEIIATDEDYAKVSDCCKYRDEEVVKNHP